MSSAEDPAGTSSSPSGGPADAADPAPQELLTRLSPQLARLPIFPLARVHLFPGALIPLYVFEPRYRDLTAACLQGGGGLAIATLCPGYEDDYQGRPPVRSIAGAGLIIAHRQNPDGTYNILVQGVCRVRFLAELPPGPEDRSYREVHAEVLADIVPSDAAGTAALALNLRMLVALTEQLAAALPQGGEVLRTLCRSLPGAGELADALSAAIIADPEARLELLENTDVPARIERLTVAVARILGEVSAQQPS